MKLKPLTVYIIKNFLAITFRSLGGLYLLKCAVRRTPYYLILNYHNFSKYNNYSIKRGSVLATGYAENFEKQIRFLTKHFTFLYPEEFFEEEPKKGLNVLISFDDGYKDNHEIAFPILKKHQVKTIFFVVTDLIGTNEWLLYDKLRLLVSENPLLERKVEEALRKMNKGLALPEDIIVLAKSQKPYSTALPRMMNWEELKDIHDSGFKIMPHTANHEILSFLKIIEQKQIIMSSISKLDLELQQKSSHFAYPNGIYDSSTIEVLSSIGIKYGFTSTPGINTKFREKLELKRIGINASDSIAILILKIFMSLVINAKNDVTHLGKKYYSKMVLLILRNFNNMKYIRYGILL